MCTLNKFTIFNIVCLIDTRGVQGHKVAQLCIQVVDETPDPGMTLLTYLRLKLRLCGTKLGNYLNSKHGLF